ncbi:MAG: hypothetical protein KGL39_47435, partial [Patescibacteria group bacterium]|nr:hypothetical protein [Patescibacteria group bacterium]
MPNRVNKSAFRRGIRPKDQDLYFVQEDVDQGFRSLLLNTPFSNGTILTLDFNTALDQTVAHKLDGAVKGMIL